MKDKKCISELYYNSLIEEDLRKKEMEILIERNENITKYPYKTTKQAAAYDVTCTGLTFKDNNKVICHTNLKMRLPENTRLILVPRSNLTNTNWVMNNSPGTGERDFQLEYQFRFTAIPTGINVMNLFRGENMFTYDEFPYKVGERIGQIYLEKITPIEFKVVQELPKLITDRKGGFGSTGK